MFAVYSRRGGSMDYGEAFHILSIVRQEEPMCRRDLAAFAMMAATLAIGAAGARQAWAGGYWNMPGTLSQRSGHGYSGGYHAPFILGPIKLDGWGAPNEVRLPCAPAPCCAHACACSCECGRMFEATSTMEGAVPTAAPPVAAQPLQAPTVAPAADSTTVVAAPQDEPSRPLFDAPVQP